MPSPHRVPPVDVRQLLRAAAASLWATFADSAAHVRPDHKGGPREARVRQFLRERLPPKWGVTRGHVYYAGDATTPEFDVIVYDALNCPALPLDIGDDARRLVPVEATLGVIEVKSTLDDRTLAAATAKLAQFDTVLEHGFTDSGYRPFRHVFAYRLDRDCNFDGWLTPALCLTRYAGAGSQPDGVFVLDDHFSVLVKAHGYAHVFGLHRGQTPDEVKWTDLEREEERLDFQFEDAWCNDYFSTSAVDGLVLLAFLTFVTQRASHYQPSNVNYADLFCRWGGPTLGGMTDFRSPPDPDLSPVSMPEA